MGCSPEDAKMATDVFIAAELRGYSSHGMIRIKDYFQLWQARSDQCETQCEDRP